MRRVTSVLLVCGRVGCATISRDSFDEHFGRADPTRYDKPLAPAASAVGYRAEVQPILERRCVEVVG